MKISIVYFSATGKTKAMAEEIAAGMAKAGGAEIRLFPIDAVDVDFVNDSAAVVFGTPDYYAGCAWQIKKWLDECPCKLAGKLGGAFCTANFKQGGADVAILGIITEILVRGMLVYSGGVSYGLPFVHLGPISEKETFEKDKELFNIYGERFAGKALELFAK